MAKTVRISDSAAKIVARYAKEHDRSKAWVTSKAIVEMCCVGQQQVSPRNRIEPATAKNEVATQDAIARFSALYVTELVPAGFPDIPSSVVGRVFGKRISALDKKLGLDDELLALFAAAVTSSDYLCGRSEKRSEPADLTWMLREENFTAILARGKKADTRKNLSADDEESLALLERELNENPELWSE